MIGRITRNINSRRDPTLISPVGPVELNVGEGEEEVLVAEAKSLLSAGLSHTGKRLLATVSNYPSFRDFKLCSLEGRSRSKWNTNCAS
jgi:hypothetical protein